MSNKQRNERMKKMTLSIVSAIALFGFASIASAQEMTGGYDTQSQGGQYGMMGGYSSGAAPQTEAASSSSDTGDAAGAALWRQLSARSITCAQLTDQNFADLGDYFMSAMMGSYHDQMDRYMTRSLGQQGDEQMHIAMGERLSGCNPTAVYPQDARGFFPMMMGGWGMGWNGSGYGTSGGYASPLGGIFSIALWLFAAIGVVAAVRWLTGKKTPLR